LEDPVVDVGRARSIALQVAFKELGLSDEKAPRRTAAKKG